MMVPLKEALSRLSFSRYFMLESITILLIGVAAIGTWMGKQIETREVNSAAAVSAIYMESIFAAELQDRPNWETLDNDQHTELDEFFIEGPLHREVLRFKLWDASGRITYSSDHAQIGLHFPVKGLLAAAFAGTVQARISELDGKDNQPELERWPRLLEIYVPIRSGANAKVVTVAEFYLSVKELEHDIRDYQQRSWVLVALITLAICLLLFNFKRLCSALDENAHMHEQLREAGVSTTTLNEEFLLRIAADLHDGPAQTIAFALMRFDEFTAMCSGCMSPDGVSQELHSIQNALQSSLQDVRRISSGLALPDLAELSLADTARRAVFNFERMSELMVQTRIDKSLDKAPLAVKITVYRLLQESLTNCMRHAQECMPQVNVEQTDGHVLVTVTDQGTGFDPQTAAAAGRLGLAFMRERVRLLGGTFEVSSAPGHGTCIRARIPLSTNEMIHD